MIFGFNTEVARDGATYHVQSELRSREALLQTQVFVRGQCIGKVSAPIPPEIAEIDSQDLLREQHRRTVAAAREGRIEELLEDESAGFSLAWRDEGPTFGRGRVRLHFVVSDGGKPLPGVEVTARFEGCRSTTQAAGQSDSRGQARFSVIMEEAELARCVLMVEAIHGERHLMHRYQLAEKKK